MKRLTLMAYGLIVLLSLPTNGFSQISRKLRVLILTDIEADPDDSQSLIRFLTYANQWNIEGFVATTSIHQKKRVAPQTIHKLIDAYGKVQPNLLRHEPGYPTARALKAIVKKGLAVYGMEGVGEGKDSEGSEWIIKILDKPDERPLWVSTWGGANTLAQALFKIRKTRSAQQAQKLYQKLRVYTISDQDDAGPWIRQSFPDIFFICSPGYTYEQATWRGITILAPGSNQQVVSNDWLAQQIQQRHGPLGAAYPDVAYGMEGDTPAFLGLIPNGLNESEHPEWGGWGGRYQFYTPTLTKVLSSYPVPDEWPKTQPETRPLWTNTEDSVFIIKDKIAYKSIQATIWRWREEFQNDFAARIEWCTKSYRQANHPPVPALAHPDRFTVTSGELFHLNADGTADPDGDSMSYLWFQYAEAGTYPKAVSFRPYAQNLYDLPVTAPIVDSPQTIHFILKVTDKGIPALSRYKRVIVQVVPK